MPSKYRTSTFTTLAWNAVHLTKCINKLYLALFYETVDLSIYIYGKGISDVNLTITKRNNWNFFWSKLHFAFSLLHGYNSFPHPH